MKTIQPDNPFFGPALVCTDADEAWYDAEISAVRARIAILESGLAALRDFSPTSRVCCADLLAILP